MKSLILFSVLTLILISCQQLKKKVVEVEFNVNKSLLSDSSFIAQTGFSINPPKNWSKTESYNSELQNKILYRLDNKLLAIYKSDSTNCILIISELPETNFDIIKRFLEKPNSYAKQDSIWTKVQSSIFKYKTYEVIQIVSQNSELIIFKLFTHRLSELYELDYVIPRSEINLNMQSVESSIGSLN
ncbi:MAG TPA: hypothetical protein VIK55_12950 [Paludibacter sp.]